MSTLTKSISVKQDPILPIREKCAGCGGEHVDVHVAAPDRFHSRGTVYQLMRCRSCSLVWLADPPHPEQMSAHYGSDYDAGIRKATEKRPKEHWQSALATIGKYKQSGTVLDLGCGAGSFLNALRSPLWTLYGIEMSVQTASLAREKTGATVFAGDILDAPFPAGSFDVITCSHVLEHVYKPAEIMRKVWTWLKPGGIVCLSVPNIDAAEARVFGSYWYPLELPRHLYHFSPNYISQLASSIGYRELELYTRRVSFIEYNSRYLFDAGMRKIGVSRPSLACTPPPGLGWRIFRKGLRLTVLPALNALISLAGEGQIIEAVFQKGEPDY